MVLHLPGLFAGPLGDDPLRYAETHTELATALEWAYRPLPGTPAPLPDDFSPKLYRPVWRWSYWLDGRLFGIPGPRLPIRDTWGTGALVGPRLASVGLFGLLLGALFRLLRGRDDTREVAGLAVLFVALHPLSVAPVAWLAARCGLLAVLGMVLAGVAAQRGRWWGVLGWGLLAVGSKETALVLPGLVWLWSTDGKAKWTSVAAASGVVIGALGLRAHLLGTPLGGFDGLPAPGSADWVHGWLGQLRYLFGPLPSDTFGTAARIGLAVFVVGLAGFGLTRRTMWLAGWLGLALLPHLQLFVQPTSGAFSRFLADAAVPLCAALALGVHRLPTRWGRLAAVALGGVFLAASVARVEAHRSAAQLIQNARMEGTIEELPPLHRGVVAGVNLDALAGPPWTAQ